VVRAHVPALTDDRYLKADLDAALAVCVDGAVLAAVEAAVGPLA
jgi:histidine ammonia-lyase